MPSTSSSSLRCPHWRGPGDVFHLMSIVSPVDRDLAVVYSPLMPVPFRERLLERGISLVEVPGEELDSMGANVLAVAPRRCVMVAGNPTTRRRLEQAGAQVIEDEGREISLKGGGGPTCLTRPLQRRSRSGRGCEVSRGPGQISRRTRSSVSTRRSASPGWNGIGGRILRTL